jgi:hypothetical protein
VVTGLVEELELMLKIQKWMHIKEILRQRGGLLGQIGRGLTRMFGGAEAQIDKLNATR